MDTREQLLKQKEEIEKQLAEVDKALKPKTIVNPDFTRLISICSDYIKDLDEKGWADEDYDHYIYETAIECVFGRDVWNWINNQDPK